MQQTLFPLLGALAVILVVCVTYNRKRKQAITTVRNYVNEFTNQQGCTKAHEYFEDGWSLITTYAISANEIGLGSLDRFHSLAIGSLATALLYAKRNDPDLAFKLEEDGEELLRAKQRIQMECATQAVILDGANLAHV